jgi:hypothetical protein
MACDEKVCQQGQAAGVMRKYVSRARRLGC